MPEHFSNLGRVFETILPFWNQFPENTQRLYEIQPQSSPKKATTRPNRSRNSQELSENSDHISPHINQHLAHRSTTWIDRPSGTNFCSPHRCRHGPAKHGESQCGHEGAHRHSTGGSEFQQACMILIWYSGIICWGFIYYNYLQYYIIMIFQYMAGWWFGTWISFSRQLLRGIIGTDHIFQRGWFSTSRWGFFSGKHGDLTSRTEPWNMEVVKWLNDSGSSAANMGTSWASHMEDASDWQTTSWLLIWTPYIDPSNVHLHFLFQKEIDMFQ